MLGERLFEGAAFADTPENEELEQLERGNAISRVLQQLKELGVNEEWENALGGIKKGTLKNELMRMGIGQDMEGVLTDGTRWKVERTGPADYEVSTGEDEEEETL